MAKTENPVKQAIKTYLDNRAKTDELFAVAYAKPNKNIDECFNYILGEAKKQGNAVYLPDEVVFGWAVHYYDEDDIKINRLLARKQRIEEKIALEKKIAEARKWEAKYQETKGKFFGICFGNENIVITVIQSVAEMAEEGQAMRHCVYSMEYYKKPNSLILSAKDKQGKRIETIEIDLKTFKVVQSRGVCNGNTDKHDEILQLVRDNINLIKQAV